MAVDFSLLPTDESERHDLPSRARWIVIYAALLMIGVLLVLVTWPRDIPTDTWKFWVTLTLFPAGVPAWVLLRRYSVYEGRRLDMALRNEANRAFVADVFQAASVPLAILGASHRFSTDREKNCAQGVRDGSLLLTTQASLAHPAGSVKARWLTFPSMRHARGANDEDRSRQVTRWLFDELIDDLAKNVQGLPSHLPLTIALSASNGLPFDESTTLWWEAWHALSLKEASLVSSDEAFADLMALDTWLDASLRGERLQATLIVAIQLHPLVDADPLSGSAEAGVALLLAPLSVALDHALSPVAWVHRPVRGSVAQPSDAFTHAMQWAGIEPSSVHRGWQVGGMDRLHTPAKPAEASPAERATAITTLDDTVGAVGVASPWLALSCAVASLADAHPTELVFAIAVPHVDVAVVTLPAVHGTSLIASSGRMGACPNLTE